MRKQFTPYNVCWHFWSFIKWFYKQYLTNIAELLTHPPKNPQISCCVITHINTADKTIIAALQNIIFRVNNCSVGYIRVWIAFITLKTTRLQHIHPFAASYMCKNLEVYSLLETEFRVHQTNKFLMFMFAVWHVLTIPNRC